MTADLPAQPLDLDAILDLVEGYGDAREATGAAFDCFSDAEIAKRDAEADQLFDAIRAEMERRRDLLGQTAAALNVALSLAIPRAERDNDDQECIEGCREALRQAVAELHPQSPTTPNPESAALIAAVDKHTEGSGR